MGTAHAGKPFLEAFASAFLIEIPLAIMKFNVEVKILNRTHAELQKTK